MTTTRLANSLVQSQTMGFLGTILETRLYGLVSKWFGLKGFFLDQTVWFSLIYTEKWGPFLRLDHMVFAKNGPIWTGPFGPTRPNEEILDHFLIYDFYCYCRALLLAK